MPFIKKLVMHGFKSFASRTEIPFEKGMNVIVGPNGSGKSVSYDTRVLLSDGSEIKIGKLVDNKIKGSINKKKLDDGIYIEGDNSIEVFALNLKTMKIEKKKISKYIKRGGDIIYRITTRTGKEVKATGCHPIIAFKDGAIKSTAISELSNKDIIATPRILDIENKKDYGIDIARFLGYIIGDGYIAKDRIEFVNNDVEVIEDFKMLLADKFKLDFRERLDKNVKRIYVRDKKFVNFVRNLFIPEYKESITSSIKKIPEGLMNSGKDSISNLLQGLYDTDGSVRKDVGIIEYCTKNKELADQIQGLLLRFGIISKIKKRVCCASNTINKIKRDYYYLYIYGKENINKFYLNIPLKVSHKRENIMKFLQHNSISATNIDILPKEINNYIKKLCFVLGIKVKPLRKSFPFLSAYIENKCAPTRKSILKLMPLFSEKLSKIEGFYSGIKLNQEYLVECIKQMNISGQSASKSIGLHPSVILRDWATSRFNAKPENLSKFYSFINYSLVERLSIAKSIINLLKIICQSDIFWDEIKSVEKLGKEEFVYDLEIEDNHNFIANNIFVHNSNITDALCFVLGRLSIKSIRAAKAANLIFAGTKDKKPAGESEVDLIFDNSDKGFPSSGPEVHLKRIVRRNGQSIYKINNETKTRQEIIELLAQAGIDPHGFNIVLQGQISGFVKMHSEDRRKVIEEVAGISIYEVRKEKSLHELEKTDERLREVMAILRERTAYLRNLEEERKQALKFKELESTVKRCKASILRKDINERDKEVQVILEEISRINNNIEHLKKQYRSTSQEILQYEDSVKEISSRIQQSGGKDQEILRQEISQLKSDLAVLEARKENFDNQIQEAERRSQGLVKNIKEIEYEIEQSKKGKKDFSGIDLKKKKQELGEIEEKRKKFYSLKTEISSLNERINDKKIDFQKTKNDSEFTLNQISKLSSGLSILELKKAQLSYKEVKQAIDELSEHEKKLTQEIIASERESAILKSRIDGLRKVEDNISKLDICPVCKTKITKEHSSKVIEETLQEIATLVSSLKESDERRKNNEILISEIREKIKLKLNLRDKLIVDINKLENIEEKKNYLTKSSQQESIIKKEIEELDKRRKLLERGIEEYQNVEDKYDRLNLEVTELMRREEANLGMAMTMKERESEQMKLIIKQNERSIEDIKQKVKDIIAEINEKSGLLEFKEKSEKEQYERFQRMFKDRSDLQEKIKEKEKKNFDLQGEIRVLEEKINNQKIEKAKVDASKEALSLDAIEFKDEEIIEGSKNFLLEKLEKSKEILISIGSVNLRALQVYDEVKQEYDKIYEKTTTLQNEKAQIMKIIEEIDIKKRRTFVKTLAAINELFTRNVSQLYSKGTAFLEVENKEDIFSAGVNIVIKIGHGKYFDSSSLSGGEQTLVALSLIFAIQEYKPYAFYIFDEIDAALDKRNSERLALLIKKYMTSGQYIIVTHNDAIITESTTLYGVSMHEGISKVLSLEV